MTRLPSLLLIVLICACSTTREAASDSTAAAGNDSTIPRAGTPVGDIPSADAWVITETSAGPIKPGMALVDARVAAGSPAQADSLNRECDYVSMPTAPAGMRFMVIDGKITRIDINGERTATERGAAIGDSEARVDSLYTGRVAKQPHKYDERGRYLIVQPSAPADSNHRLVFETDGTRVTRYRIGLMPSVLWVEGCS